MAASTQRIYELQVKLAADSLAQLKKLETHAKKTANSVGFLESTIKGLGAGLVAGFSVDAFLGGMSAAIEKVDSLATSAERLGVSVESFSSLAFAAEQSDVSVGSLESGMKKLSVAMADSGSKAARVMAALNVDQSGGVEQTMLNIADAIQSIQDPTQKTAALMAIFGRSGADLAPLMNKGAEGIKNLTDEADRLGITVNGEQAAALGELDNLMLKMSASTDAAFRSIAVGLAPTLLELGNIFIDTAEDTDLMTEAGEKLGIVLRGLANAGAVIKTGFEVAGGTIGAVGAAAVSAATGEFGQAADIIKMRMDDTAQAAQDLGKNILLISTEEKALVAPVQEASAATAEQQAVAAKLAATLDSQTNKALEGQAKAAAAAASEAERYVLTLQKEVDGLRQKETLMSELDILNEELANGTRTLTQEQLAHVEALLAQKAAYEETAAATEAEQKLVAEGVALTERLRTSREVMAAQLEHYNELLAKGAIDTDTYNRAVWDSAKAHTDAEAAAAKSKEGLIGMDAVVAELSDKIDGYGKDLAGSLVDFATNSDEGAASFSDFAASVLSDIAKMIVQMMVMEPLMKSIKAGMAGMGGGMGAAGGAAGGGMGGILSGILGSLFSADGNVVQGGHHLSAYAKGGVVNRPTVFPMANGAGLMGEAGPEGILPLSRDASGVLGVNAAGMGGAQVVVNVYNNGEKTKVEVEEEKGDDGSTMINIMIETAMDKAIAKGRFDSTFQTAYGVTRRGR